MRRGTIAGCRLSGKTGSHPVHLIFQRAIDDRIMTETWVDVALDLSPSGAQALKNFPTRRGSKNTIGTATHQKHWGVDRVRARLVPRKELLDVLVVSPARLEHLLRRERRKCTTRGAASVFH